MVKNKIIDHLIFTKQTEKEMKMKITVTAAIISVFMLVACSEKETPTGFVDSNGKSMTKEQAQAAALEEAQKILKAPIPKFQDNGQKQKHEPFNLYKKSNSND